MLSSGGASSVIPWASQGHLTTESFHSIPAPNTHEAEKMTAWAPTNGDVDGGGQGAYNVACKCVALNVTTVQDNHTSESQV